MSRSRRGAVQPRFVSTCFSAKIFFISISVVLRFSIAYGDETVVCLEAESAIRTIPPMEIVRATNTSAPGANEASGGAYLEVAQGKGNPPNVGGEAVIRFETKKAGQYDLWCRVWWDDECGNSFTMVLNDGKPFVFGQDSTFKCWHWVRAPRVKQLYLKPGVNTLRIQNREDGVRLDQVLFTLNQRYVPVGVEKTTPQEPNTGHHP